MSTTPARIRRRASGLAAATAFLMLGPVTAAWATPEGRIQDVVSEPGSVSLILSAEGLDEGESIDPTSVGVTIGGVASAATASPIDEAVTAPQRTVMLVLDSSGSMGEAGTLDTAKAAANQYLDSLPPGVDAGLIAFADQARMVVAPTQDLASVRAAVEELRADGATALNDAVALAAEELGTEGSRNIVLLSDGEDEGSVASRKQSRQALAASGALLDAVSLGKGGQEQELAAFAAAGNGSLVTATDADSLSAAFESAARSVTTQLAVTAEVPDGIEAGTAELTVTAQAGGQTITDTAATLVAPASDSASTTEDAFGPIAVAEREPGLLDQRWFLITMIAMVFVALATIAALALGSLDSKNRKEGRVRRRLDEVSTAGRPAPQASTDSQTALGDGRMTRAVLSFADRVAASRDTSALAKRLDRANVALRPAEWAVVHGLIVVLAGLAAALLGGFRPMITLIAVVAAAAIPWAYLGHRASRRQAEFYASLPDSLQMMAGSLSAGYSLPQALDGVARETGGTFGQETKRALLESRLGLPIEESLEATAQRMNSADFHWVVMAIRTNRQVGGNLAEVLTNVGKTLRERERLRRQVKTLSAEGKLSAWIIGALPILMLIFMVMFQSDFVAPLFTSLVGWVMVAMGAVAYVVGIIWMRTLVNMEV